MKDHTYSEIATIKAILALSPRLKYILLQNHSIDIDGIASIRVDGDNYKIDINLTDSMLRFKAKSLTHALIPHPSSGGLTMVMDPALAQGIYNIVDDFGR